MVSIAPIPIDITDFQFKAHCRLKVFERDNNDDFGEVCNLVSVADRYGLIFIGSNSNDLQVVQVKHIEEHSKEVGSFKRRLHPLRSRPLHVSVNCDSSKLAIVTQTPNGPFVYIYDLLSFLSQNVRISHEIRLSSNPNCKVRSIEWNPALPLILSVCKNDGSLGVYHFKGMSYEFNELLPNSGTTCFCWSPKGKQVAVGSLDGKITQYQPTLKPVKAINAPPGYKTINTLCWISSFQFMAIYVNQSDENCLICIGAPKQGPLEFTNFEDVCYSNGTARPQQFYLIHQPHWNVLFVASSNSMEVGILGMENSKWTPWTLSDNSRAELPLSAKKEDTFPIGVCFNTGSSSYRVGSEVKQAPMLMILSNHGLLCTFHTLNLRPNSTGICLPLEAVPDRSGDHFYTNSTVSIQKPLLPSLDLIQPPAQPVPVNLAPHSDSTFTVPQIKPQPALFGQVGSNLTGEVKAQVQVQSVTSGAPSANVPVISSLLQNPTLDLTGDMSKIVTPEPSPLQVSVVSKQPVPESQHNEVIDKLPVNEETNAVIAQLIREKCANIDNDVRNILQRGYGIDIQLGPESELSSLEKNVQDMDKFFTEIKENVDTLDSEIYTLNQNLIQTWACFEESRTRFQTSKDPLTRVLLQSLPLDPASQQQLDDITYSIFYIETQVQQANQALDERWDTFQTALRKSGGLPLPTMESIYQTMVQHSKTTQKLKCTLKHIYNRVKSANRSSVLFNVSLAERYDVQELEEELLKLNVNSEQRETIPQRFSRLLVRQSNLNVNKCRKLDSMMATHETTRICASKPQFNNSTIHLSTFLDGPLSPIKGAQGGANLLLMSTPKPQEIKILKQPVQTFTPPQLSNVQESSPGFPTHNSDNLTPIIHKTPCTMNTLITPVPGTGSIQVLKPVPTPSTSSNSLFATTSSSSGFSFPKLLQYNSSSSVPTFFSSTVASTAPTPSLPSNTTLVSKNIFGNVSQSISTGKPFTFGESSSFPVSAMSTSSITSVSEISAESPISLGRTPLLATPSMAPSLTEPTTNVFNFSKSTTQQSVSNNKTPGITSILPTSTGAVDPVFGGSTLSQSSATSGVVSTNKSLFASLATPATTTSFSNLNIFAVKANSNISGSSLNPSTTSTSLTPAIIKTVAASITPTTTSITSQSIVATVPPSVPTTATKPSIPIASISATPVAKPPIIVYESTGLGTTFTTITTPVTTTTCINSTITANPAVNPAPTVTILPFGASKPTTIDAPHVSMFPVDTSSPAPTFKTPTPSTIGPSNIFGNTSTTSTTTQSQFFGTTAQGSFFSTTQALPFGSSAFGAVPATPIVAVATSTTTGNLFGQTPVTSASSFGQVTAAPSTSTPFVGGSGTSTFSSTSSIFGQPAKFNSGSIFGGGAPTTTSVFGSSTSGSVFGQASTQSSPFGSGANAFGQSSPFAPAIATTTTSSGFGQAAPAFGSSSTFGSSQPFGNPAISSAGGFGSSFGSLTVGSAPSGGFGQAAAAANPFGKSIDQKSAFGSTTGSLFSAPVTTSSANIFGSPAATANKSIFGGGAAFGSPGFGMPQMPTGAFSSGGQSVQQTGFGRSPLFQSSTFVSPSTFGQSSTFGGSPSFGGAPSFGGGAAFGSPPKVFGSGADTGATFGSAAAPQEATFGSLAQQDTVGFGNLAQQASQVPAMSFSGGSSFTNWRN